MQQMSMADYDVEVSDTINTSNTYYWSDYNTYTVPSTFTWTTTIYLYQLKCPKCRASNWGELDKIVTCKKCSSSLKAVSKKVDYEIAID